MIKGIDVSSWQGRIDWSKVKADGIGFAILRLGYGSDRKDQDDKYFEYNAIECERLNIPYGVYIYSYADEISDADREADHVLRLIKGKKLTYPVFYDLEEDRTAKMGKANILELSKRFVSKIEAAGFKCGIYANKYWNTTYLTDSWYNSKPRWIAQYNSKCTYSGKYDIWQYSSSGRVDGISGGVDMNYCYVEYSEKKAETPKPTKTIDQLAREVLDGKYGNGDARKKALGDQYNAVQKRVNEILAEQKKPVEIKPVKGAAVKLTNKSYYATSDSKSPLKQKLNGTYYIYDGEKINGRYRITNSKDKCGKKPIANNVTGWITI